MVFPGSLICGSQELFLFKASKDFILWLDVNDAVPANEQEKLLALKQMMDECCDMVVMQYWTVFDRED